MKRSLSVALIWTIAVTGAAVAPSNAATDVFPNVTGKNLNGKAFALPADFEGPAIVYVAFVREHQEQVDSWKPFVAATLGRFPKVGEYEVPTLSKGNALFRGFIDGGMRRGIPDIAVRARTITLYIDKRPFDASLGIASERDIAVLLIDRDGIILWRASGAFESAKTTGLDTALERVSKSDR